MKPRVLVFAGSTRTDSLHRKLARSAAEALRRAGAEVTLADLKDYPMPLYDGDIEAAQGPPAAAKAFRDLLQTHDALVIASPEYNGSFPAILKNAVDWLSRPQAGERPAQAFRGKIAALLSTSPGPSGGRRGLKHLRELLTMIGVAVIPEELAIPGAFDVMDSQGNLLRQEDREALDRLALHLVHASTRAQAA
jgi:NAD(P)H-dependent FMN reductase